MRKGIIIDTLTSFDIVENAKCGGFNLEVFGWFFCHELECNPLQILLTMCLIKWTDWKHEEEIYFKI